jgi:hypothetical protein
MVHEFNVLYAIKNKTSIILNIWGFFCLSSTHEHSYYYSIKNLNKMQIESTWSSLHQENFFSHLKKVKCVIICT